MGLTMKYIRTKYGIYNAIKEFKIGDMIGVPYNGLVKIIAQADTIEELCDEFVGIKESKKPIVQSSYTKLKPSLYILKNDLDIKEIYGAIWTDKGLIYVARMNSKGELELL